MDPAEEQDQSNAAVYPSLRNKKVLISGGAEGIGAAAVELFCRQGACVAFLDWARTPAEELVERIAAMPGATRPIFELCDVRDLEQVRITTKMALQRLSNGSDGNSDSDTFDVLINNAGAAGAEARVPTTDVTPSSFDDTININLRHQFFLTQIVAPAMARRGTGSIINIGSITWRVPAVGLPIYTAAKAAVMGLTRTHAREFGAAGVRVNSIMPGAIATRRQIESVLTPAYRDECFAAQALKRVLMPVEVARLMLFLASDDASAITGASYVVDGGWVGDP